MVQEMVGKHVVDGFIYRGREYIPRHKGQSRCVTVNGTGMVEDARLAFWVGLHVANVDETPGWKPGDEFEAIRQQMLAESPD